MYLLVNIKIFPVSFLLGVLQTQNCLILSFLILKNFERITQMLKINNYFNRIFKNKLLFFFNNSIPF